MASERRCNSPRILIVDVNPPHWTLLRTQLCDALRNTLCLAAATLPSGDLLSVYTLREKQQCLLPLLPIKGNFLRLQSCVSELRSLPGEGSCTIHNMSLPLAVLDALQQNRQITQHLSSGATMHCRFIESCVSELRSLPGEGSCTIHNMLLPLAVLDALQQNRQITQHLSSGATMHCRFIEITVLSPRAGQEMAALLDEGLKEADLALLRRLMVVQIQCDVEDRASSRSPCSDSQDTRCHVYDIEFLTVAGDVISLECFFKSWLLKWSFEKEEVRLILPTRDTRLQIICDVQHPLLPPNLQDDEQKPRATTQTIRVMRALSSQGICGSMLYGLPSVLTPTACWELDWEELESNQENFHALCHQLQSEGLSLLGCSSQRSVSWAPAVMSYVIVTPCDTLAVLLRPVVTRELLLPIHPPTVTGPVADNAVHRIQEALSSLRVETVYNPLQVSSHLYQHLQTTLARPAAAPLRHVTTAFRGGRGHNRQLPSSSGRLRATIAPLTLVTPNPCKRGQQVQEDPPSKRRFHDEDEDGL